VSLADAYMNIMDGAKDAAARTKKAILKKAKNCKHERIELVEAHENYQLGVCVNCKMMFRREKS